MMDNYYILDSEDPLHTSTEEPVHICTYTTDSQGIKSCEVCRRIINID